MRETWSKGYCQGVAVNLSVNLFKIKFFQAPLGDQTTSEGKIRIQKCEIQATLYF